MREGTSVTKILGRLDDGEVRLFKVSRTRFHLHFGRGTPDTYMESRIWFTRDQLRIVSDLLVEALEEGGGG